MKNFKLLPALIFTVLLSVSCDKDSLTSSATNNASASANKTAFSKTAPTPTPTTVYIAPGGPYNLNMIGIDKGMPANMSGDISGYIFTIVGGKIPAINLSLGDYKVLDYAGTDGTASFQLPLFGQGTSASYSVYVRALGGTPKINNCGQDVDYIKICSTTVTVASRASSVSTQLLTAVLPSGARISIFDPSFQGYLWQYVDPMTRQPADHNTGVRLVQLRFYANLPQ